MSKYRIRVERLDGSESLDEVYAAGLECEGFAFILKEGDGVGVAIRDMSLDNIADAMSESDNLHAAGILGRAKRQVEEVMRRKQTGELLGSLINSNRKE